MSFNSANFNPPEFTPHAMNAPVSPPQSCLIVDDNELLRERLAEAIAERGIRTRTAKNYDEAVRLLREESPELAVVDLKMPGQSGLDLLRTMKELSPDTRAVVCTGFGSIANAVEAIHAGAVNYVTKPADADEILAAFRRVSEFAEVEPPTDPQYQPPTLAENEWEYIQQVLADCDGNISKAARLLGIERRTLQRKLKKVRP